MPDKGDKRLATAVELIEKREFVEKVDEVLIEEQKVNFIFGLYSFTVNRSYFI